MFMNRKAAKRKYLIEILSKMTKRQQRFFLTILK